MGLRCPVTPEKQFVLALSAGVDEDELVHPAFSWQPSLNLQAPVFWTDRLSPMNFHHYSLMSLLAATLAGVIGTARVEAGCPCNQKGGNISGPISGPMYADPGAGLTPYLETSAPWGMPGAVPSAPGYGAGARVPSAAVPSSVGPGYSAATATTWQPPPGTIGQTYQIKSRPVPVKMHPRAAIVDVRVPNAKDVRVHDMNVYRTQDFLEGFQDDREPSMWHFTSEPLIPGIPHIYRIEARFVDDDGKERMEERYVRLIMGRVIEVTF